MTARIMHGDCRELMARLPAASVDSIVTDPPYHLTTSKKSGCGQTSLNLDTPAGRARIGTGFMGMKWDGGDVAFDPATWMEALRVLKPGGMVVAFGGTRTYHRLVCAIEDAGFEIRDMLGWLYGNGFPKGTDKAKIPEAWRGWNTALKPAIEPICLARKPMVGTLAENLAAYGTGALWVDGCRIGWEPQDLDAISPRSGLSRREYSQADGEFLANFNVKTAPFAERKSDGGRWPANVMHDGSDEVLQVFPANAGAAAPVHRRNGDKFRGTYGAFKGDVDEQGSTFHGDAGSAARFFYCPKATRADRNAGLEDLPQKPLLWSAGSQNAGAFQSAGTNRASQNNHPTVKPIGLMRWLCRLVTPPRGVLLDPFMGSGSTIKAAELEGFDSIGIELNADYVAIAEGRVAGVAA